MHATSLPDADLCILVTTGPEHENGRTLHGIARAAIRLGGRLRIFLMHEGVYHVLEPAFLELAVRGAEVALCGQNARERGIEAAEGVLFGSQYDLAVMVSRSQAFLALT